MANLTKKLDKNLEVPILHPLWRVAVFTLCCLVPNLALAQGENRAGKIYTPEIAKRALGEAAKAMENDPDAPVLDGEWTSIYSYTFGSSAGVSTLTIVHKPNAGEAVMGFGLRKETNHGVDVSGLGEKAFRSSNQHMLYVLVGRNIVTVTAGISSRSDDIDAQIRIAKAVLPGLTEYK